MQEYWEIYMKNLEGYPASVLFNAGIAMDISDMELSHPNIAFVKVKLKSEHPKGLLSSDEEPEVSFLEDKLEASLIKFRIGKYVGRIISNGYVTFLYYLQFTYNWKDFLDFALEEHQNYEITSDHKEDALWNYYNTLLYPSSKEWQIIQNHKVCDALKKQGDNLYLARAIEHKAYFQSEYKKADFIEKLEEKGFTIGKELTLEKGYSGISFYRIDKPFYEDIDELTLKLITLSEEYDTSYDGWETSVVKS